MSIAARRIGDVVLKLDNISLSGYDVEGRAERACDSLYRRSRAGDRGHPFHRQRAEIGRGESEARHRQTLHDDEDGQALIAPHKARIHALRLADNFDSLETFQHLLPHDLQLKFRKPHPDAAVDAEAEG